MTRHHQQPRTVGTTPWRSEFRDGAYVALRDNRIASPPFSSIGACLLFIADRMQEEAKNERAKTE